MRRPGLPGLAKRDIFNEAANYWRPAVRGDPTACADLIEPVMALWRALVAGDDHRVGRLVPLLADLVALQARLDGFLAVEKHLLVRQGVLSSTVMQGPVAFELDAEMRSEVDRRFDALMAAVWQ